MADYTIKRVDEMEEIFDGAVARARASLGVSAFGMQLLSLPPSWDGYPNHNHREDAFDGSAGQEEVYVALTRLGNAPCRRHGPPARARRRRSGGTGREAPDRSRRRGRAGAVPRRVAGPGLRAARLD